MKLTIKNLAKIREATLEINGITLICGANDSGKSTCGKALCALVNAIVQLKERSLEIRKAKLLQAISLAVNNSIYPWEFHVIPFQKYLQGKISVDDFIKRIFCVLTEREDEEDGEGEERVDVSQVDRSEFSRKLEEIRALPEKDFYAAAVSRCLTSAFNKQILPIFLGKEDGAACETILALENMQQKTVVHLRDGGCELDMSLGIQDYLHRAWYVGHPHLVDDLSDRPLLASDQFSYAIRKEILRNRRTGKQDPVENAFDDALMKERYGRLQESFLQTLAGEIVEEDDEFALRRDCWKKPLRLSNASMGIKSLALIQMMLDAQMLREGDVLVLDEPEVHLHPDWQLVYAELIVLLNKVLGIKVLLTTHSSEFIRAIQLYSQKHRTFDKVTAYLSEGDVQVTIRPVKEWDELYDRFIPMVEKLDRMDAELSRERIADEM